jgi:phosphoribosylformylglycinamidine (FGAM) synthase-like enzyme
LFSFYGVSADGSPIAWDIVNCVNEAAAAEHAVELVLLHPNVVAVEVWMIERYCFSVPAKSYRAAISAHDCGLGTHSSTNSLRMSEAVVSAERPSISVLEPEP